MSAKTIKTKGVTKLPVIHKNYALNVITMIHTLFKVIKIIR